MADRSPLPLLSLLALVLSFFAILSISSNSDDGSDRGRPIRYEEMPKRNIKEQLELQEDPIYMAELKNLHREREKKVDPFQDLNDCWISRSRKCMEGCFERSFQLFPAFFRDMLSSIQTSNETGLIKVFSTVIKYPKSEILDEICSAQCQASISWNCTQRFLQKGGTRVVKFGGRWPFRPLGFIVEPASALAALTSCFLQLFFLNKYLRTFSHLMSTREAFSENGHLFSERRKMVGAHLLWIVTFFSAFLFHTVDITLTERMDYLSVMITLLYNSSISVNRFLSDLLPEKDNRASSTSEHSRRPLRRLFSTLIYLAFALFAFSHVYFMLYIKFDYSYNMKVAIGCLLLFSSAWCLWSLRNLRTHPAAKLHLIGHPLLLLFGALEIFDFPPVWGVFDGHALWHFLLNIVLYILHSFSISDLYFHFPKRND